MDRLLSTGLALAMALAPVTAALAHGGGLDRHGCHHDRKNGGYHCHRSPGPSASSAQPEPGYSARNNLTGYVTPASGGGAYRNCTAARAAGAAPVRRGDSGYGTHLDRDGDGVGCE